jgi:hypothetical protein
MEAVDVARTAVMLHVVRDAEYASGGSLPIDQFFAQSPAKTDGLPCADCDQ